MIKQRLFIGVISLLCLSLFGCNIPTQTLKRAEFLGPDVPLYGDWKACLILYQDGHYEPALYFGGDIDDGNAYNLGLSWAYQNGVKVLLEPNHYGY